MKKKRKRNSKGRASGIRGPFFRSLPVSELSEVERKEIASSLGEQARLEVAEALAHLQELTLRVEPFLALAVMESYALMRFSTGRTSQADSPGPVQQGHVEFLQAMFVRAFPDEQLPVATADDIQALFDLLPRLFAAQHHVRMPSREELEKPETPEQGSLRMVQEYLRAHTTVVRNWGYFGSVTRISNELFSGIDAQFKAQFQLAATDVARLFVHLVRRQERRVSAHWRNLHDVLALDSVDLMVDAFFEQFPFKGEAAESAANMKREAGTAQRLKYALLPLADRYLTGEFFFRSEHIAAELGLSSSGLDGLLSKISLPLGSLVGDSPERLFLDNPVWLKPLIVLPNGEYFCALPQTLLSFVFPILDEFVKPYPSLARKLSDVRADYLEAEVERQLRIAFPEAQFATQFKWQSEGQEFETDILLRFDTTLLLVEAKSGKVSWSALRGAPARLVEHVRNLIVAPSEQSGRLAAELQKEIEWRKQGGAPRLDFPMLLDNVTAVLRLSVTLHDFATVQSVPALLAQAGVLENQYPLAPCISLADLEVMIDLLEQPHVRLHYIRQRASTHLSQHVIGDELDMLGLYLDTSLSFGGLPPGEQRIFLNGYSDRLDRYYTARDEGEPTRKPRRATTAWFNRLCDQISQRPIAGWSEMTSALLSLTPHHQQELERKIQKLSRRMREGKPLPHNEDTVVFVGPEWVHTALAVQARDRWRPGRLGQDAEAIASLAFKQEHVERCCVIVVDALSPELPYLSGSVWTRADRPVPATIFF